jgi:hypothetical protein
MFRKTVKNIYKPIKKKQSFLSPSSSNNLASCSTSSSKWLSPPPTLVKATPPNLSFTLSGSFANTAFLNLTNITRFQSFFYLSFFLISMINPAKTTAAPRVKTIANTAAATLRRGVRSELETVPVDCGGHLAGIGSKLSPVL